MLSIILTTSLERGFLLKPALDSPSAVSDPEAPRFDTTNSSGANDEDVLLNREMEDLPSVAFGYTFGDESDSFDLWEGHDLKSGRVDGTRGGKVDNDVCIGVLLDGLLHGGVDGKEGLLSAPVKLLDVMTTEWVDHGRNTGSFSAATVVEVKHALNGARLKSIDEGTCSSVKRFVRRSF